jgi:hypothetical protein
MFFDSIGNSSSVCFLFELNFICLMEDKRMCHMKQNEIFLLQINHKSFDVWDCDSSFFLSLSLSLSGCVCVF